MITQLAARRITPDINTSDPYILLAEDDTDDQEFLIDAVARHSKDVDIRTINNGKKALLFLEGLTNDTLPCLIILDYNLPEIDGAQLLEILGNNKRYNKIPKIVWSTSNSPYYKQVCMELGANAYFVKPCDVDGINNLAREMLSIIYV